MEYFCICCVADVSEQNILPQSCYIFLYLDFIMFCNRSKAVQFYKKQNRQYEYSTVPNK